MKWAPGVCSIKDEGCGSCSISREIGFIEKLSEFENSTFSFVEGFLGSANLRILSDGETLEFLIGR